MDFIKNFTKAIESLADFQPHMFNGATEKELFALEEKLGLTLPSDFKVFLDSRGCFLRCRSWNAKS